MTKKTEPLSGQRFMILEALAAAGDPPGLQPAAAGPQSGAGRLSGAGYVSGERLSEALALSRTAIWKHIQELRAAGVAIEAHPRLGYRLEAPEQVILPGSVAARRRLHAAGGIGEPLVCHPDVPSTNDRARSLGAAGAPHGATVIAWRQSRGRGRLGRAWLSPTGGLWMSILLRPPLAPVEVSRLTLLAAVAVAEGVAAASGLQAGIKWPNDLLLGERKFCGILTELAAEADRVSYAVVGIGVNANLTAEQLPSQAVTPPTSLLLAGGRPVSLPSLAAAILDGFDTWYARLLTEGFEPVRSRWRELSITIGREVTAALPQGGLVGTAIDLGEDGALVLELPDGSRRRILAGDVTLSPAAEERP